MTAFKRLLTPSYESNIPKFFVYQVLNNFMLFLPVWVIYLQRKFNLSLTEVTFNDSAFWLTMALTEVPTGAVADTWGRKQSQLIGLGIVTVSVLGFALAPVYPLVLVANSLWAIGITFISGADLALFYDTLRALGREAEYDKLRGRMWALTFMSIALSSVLGGVVGEFSLVATFLITALMFLAAGFIVLTLKEPPRATDQATGQNFSYGQILRVTFDTIRQFPNLRYLLIYSSLLPVLGATLRVTFMQPHALAIGLPLAVLGVVSFGMRGLQFLGALYANRTVKRVGEWNWLRTAPLIVTICVIALGLFNSIGGIMIFAISGFATAVKPR